MAKKPKSSTKKPIHDVNWYNDKYQSNVVLRNWAIVITFIAVTGILLMTVASYYFVPLKSVSPFIIQIDENTGITEVIDSRDASQFTQNELLIKYFAHQYILAREEYSYLTYDENQQIVRYMSMPEVFREYANFMESPNGYKTLFNVRTDRKAQVISTQLKLNRTTGSTEVITRLRITETTTRSRPIDYTISVRLQCHFDQASKLSEDQRLINPLAFAVEYYDTNKERPDEDNKNAQN